MRLVVGIALIDRGVTRLWSAHPIQVIIFCVLATGAGALLLAGLWTPVAGTLVAAIEVWKIFLHPEDPWICWPGSFGILASCRWGQHNEFERYMYQCTQ